MVNVRTLLQKYTVLFEENTVLFEENTAHFKENTVCFKENTVFFEENIVLFEENTVHFEENTVLFEENTVLFEENTTLLQNISFGGLKTRYSMLTGVIRGAGNGKESKKGEMKGCFWSFFGELPENFFSAQFWGGSGLGFGGEENIENKYYFCLG